MNKKIIYIAEFDADVDDIVAAHWLYKENVLFGVVLDPLPKSKEGWDRVKQCENLGINILKEIPKDTDIIILGGGFKLLSEYIKDNYLGVLIANGGFVGKNLNPNPLEKFKNKTEIRTFNFNIDVNSTDKVLKSKNIGKIYLIGKNVCHDIKNTRLNIWKNESELLDIYNVNETKRLHDVLAAKEGLILEGIINEKSLINYKEVYPYNLGLNGNMTLWGSKLEKTDYHKTISAINWK